MEPMNTLSQLRDALATALAEQARLEALYKDALAAWEAEMRPLLDARAAIKARVKTLDADARAEIQAAVETAGELPPLTGFGYQMRETVVCDEPAMLEWAQSYAPELVKTELAGSKALLEWLKARPVTTDFETGEVVRVVSGPGGIFRVPASIGRAVTPVISEKALLTLQDERVWEAGR